mmetsp:Transcript_11725/g.31552  ORF Transcript_11725/g.31552 Transcript_11725/m.31552 type:complete len:303 (-) Transcript_11725:320-1228(-)
MRHPSTAWSCASPTRTLSARSSTRRSRVTWLWPLPTRTSFRATASRWVSPTMPHATRLVCCLRAAPSKSLALTRRTRVRPSPMARCTRWRRTMMVRALSRACLMSASCAPPRAIVCLAPSRARLMAASTSPTARSASRATTPRRRTSTRRPTASTSSADTCRSTWRCSRRTTRTATRSSSPSSSRTTSALMISRRCTRRRMRRSARIPPCRRQRSRTATLSTRRRRCPCPRSATASARRSSHTRRSRPQRMMRRRTTSRLAGVLTRTFQCMAPGWGLVSRPARPVGAWRTRVGSGETSKCLI